MSTKTESAIYIAINMTKVVNRPESFELMRRVGPKVCILTANSPGFLGFQANYETGILPFAGRFGGAGIHMERELNPIRLYQYTMWRTVEDHDAFHLENFARFVELCVHCLSMVVEGPREPLYSVVAAEMPARPTPERWVAVTEHAVKTGQEAAFERGVVQTMDALSDSAGFLGYMLLKQIGVGAIGSFMLDPKSMVQMLETLGAHPPDDPRPAFETREVAPSPSEYLIHSEWASPELAELGFERLLVNHEIRRLHGEGVMAHVLRGPYTVLFRPMMEESTFRERLR
jgi:sulfur oxygenase/reductase